MPSFIPGGPKGHSDLKFGYKKLREVGTPVEKIAKLKNSIVVAKTTIGIFYGTLADADVGIIVNPTNRDCILIPQGITGDLIATEGPLLPILAFHGGAIEYGQVKITKVRSLHAEYVMHLAIDPNPVERQENDAPLTEEAKLDLVRYCTLNALAEAEKMANSLNKKSIAFPALGTDIHGIRPGEAVKIMLAAIAEYAKTSSLEKIQIILHNEGYFYEFNRELNQLQAKIRNAALLTAK